MFQTQCLCSPKSYFHRALVELLSHRLQIHQIYATTINAEVPSYNVAVNEPSIMNTHKSQLHLGAGGFVDWIIVRDNTTNIMILQHDLTENCGLLWSSPLDARILKFITN